MWADALRWVAVAALASVAVVAGVCVWLIAMLAKDAHDLLKGAPK
jgi:hypothetical protein